MALPKLETGTRYTLELPSNGKKVDYRPFLVKEEKILLQAINSQDEDEVMMAIKNVAENCTFGKLDVDTIPFVDLEWIFLKLRMRSKGETVEAKYKCKNPVSYEDNGDTLQKECGHINEVQLDLEKVVISQQDKKASNIILQEKGPIGLNLMYPTKAFAEKWKKVAGEKDPMKMFDMLIDSIEYIYSGEELFYPKEVTREELDDFLDQLSEVQFAKINDFFKELPELTYELDFKCAGCGYEQKKTLRGLKSFLV